MKILNANSRYPGSTHDSYIWRRSNVSTLIERMHSEGLSSYYLLGYLLYIYIYFFSNNIMC